MQIVIDIPEEEYQTYINHTEAILDSSIPLVHQDLLRAVINGTPLPKSHGRLIDADALIDSLDASDRDIYCKAVIEEDAPTIIEADGCGTETWNGYHGQVTAPKGTFKRIYADADGGDAE